MQRHRHQEIIYFLNAIKAEIPAGKGVHVILDNYAAHKHPKVRVWLGRHERFTFHFVPTSCTWLNAVEGFFAKLSKRCLKRGVFRSIVDPQLAINRFLPLVFNRLVDQCSQPALVVEPPGRNQLGQVDHDQFFHRVYPVGRVIGAAPAKLSLGAG